jgi:hypothetical protein
VPVTPTVAPRVVAWLRRQDQAQRIGQIARGAGVVPGTVRTVLAALDQAGRLAVSGPGGERAYLLTDVRQVRVSVRDDEADGGGWWEPETVPAAVLALRALADHRTLGTIGPDGRARLRAALDELDAALAGYPDGRQP